MTNVWLRQACQQAVLTAMCLRSLLPCATQRPKSNVTIFVAYVEVYNEDVYDLLDSKKGRTKLKIHKTTRVCSPLLFEAQVCAETDASIVNHTGLGKTMAH